MGLFREKFIRLQHENKLLRVQQEESEREKIATLQAQLEEAHKAQSELNTENRSDQHICVHYDSGCTHHPCFKHCFYISLLRPTCRLKQERVCELQQQVEDLQKALQIQAIKPDEVRESPSLKAQK